MKDLRKLRLEKGISQRELARRIGITNSTVCRYETGQREVLLSTAIKLAKFYGMTVEELFCEHEPKKEVDIKKIVHEYLTNFKEGILQNLAFGITRYYELETTNYEELEESICEVLEDELFKG